MLDVNLQENCHSITFDNIFSSYPLFTELLEKGIAATGTMRSNRILNNPPLCESEMKKKERGTVDFASDGNVVVCAWLDNKVVHEASNFTQISPFVLKRRFSQSLKKRIDVNCPALIAQYNQNMGSVDLCDRFLNNYRPCIMGKKWWYFIFSHSINILLVASWRIHCAVDGRLSQLEFLRYVTRCLLKVEKTSNQIIFPSQLTEIRFDGINHKHKKGRKEGRCSLLKKHIFFVY